MPRNRPVPFLYMLPVVFLSAAILTVPAMMFGIEANRLTFTGAFWLAWAAMVATALGLVWVIARYGFWSTATAITAMTAALVWGFLFGNFGEGASPMMTFGFSLAVPLLPLGFAYHVKDTAYARLDSNRVHELAIRLDQAAKSWIAAQKYPDLSAHFANTALVTLSDIKKGKGYLSPARRNRAIGNLETHFDWLKFAQDQKLDMDFLVLARIASATQHLVTVEPEIALPDIEYVEKA